MKHKWITYDRASSGTGPAGHGWICTECLSWRHETTAQPDHAPPLEEGCRANDMTFEGGVRPSWSPAPGDVPAKCPTRVRILGLNYAVEIVELGDGTLGQFHLGLARIQLRVDLPPIVEASTLLHELIHALSITLKIGLSENAICRLEAGMMALLCDNRDTLVPFLIHQPGGENE